MLVRILVLLFRLSYRHSRGFNPVGIREFGPGLRRGVTILGGGYVITPAKSYFVL